MAKLSRFDRLNQALDKMLARTDTLPVRTDAEIAALLRGQSELLARLAVVERTIARRD